MNTTTVPTTHTHTDPLHPVQNNLEPHNGLRAHNKVSSEYARTDYGNGHTNGDNHFGDSHHHDSHHEHDKTSAFPVHRNRTRLNPVPLGMMAFAATLLLFSLVNVRARRLVSPQIVLSLGFFYGGLVQLIAGIFAGVIGATFAFTTLLTYAAFWASFSLIYYPSSNIAGVYSATAGGSFESALGIYYIVWFIVSLVFTIGALKSSAALVAFFALLDMNFLLLAISGFRNSFPTQRAAGVFGVFASVVALYIAASGLYHRETSYLVLPVGPLHSKDNDSYNNNHSGTTTGAEMSHANGTNVPRRGLFGKKSAA